MLRRGLAVTAALVLLLAVVARCVWLTPADTGGAAAPVALSAARSSRPAVVVSPGQDVMLPVGVTAARLPLQKLRIGVGMAGPDAALSGRYAHVRVRMWAADGDLERGGVSMVEFVEERWRAGDGSGRVVRTRMPDSLGVVAVTDVTVFGPGGLPMGPEPLPTDPAVLAFGDRWSAYVGDGSDGRHPGGGGPGRLAQPEPASADGDAGRAGEHGRVDVAGVDDRPGRETWGSSGLRRPGRAGSAGPRPRLG